MDQAPRGGWSSAKCSASNCNWGAFDWSERQRAKNTGQGTYLPAKSVSSVMCCVVIAQSCPTIAINPRSHRLSLTAGDFWHGKTGG